MGFQWTLIAYFLYVEIACVVILLLPFISATQLDNIFNSQLVRRLSAHASYYFKVILAILAFLFLDSLRGINKYNNILSNEVSHLHDDKKLAKEFREQRNMYITGSAILLCFVINRIIGLNTEIVNLKKDASKKKN